MFNAFVAYGAVGIGEGFQVELYLQQELVGLWLLREGGWSQVEVQKLECLWPYLGNAVSI